MVDTVCLGAPVNSRARLPENLLSERHVSAVRGGGPRKLKNGVMGYCVLNRWIGAGAVVGALALPFLRRRWPLDTLMASTAVIFAPALLVVGWWHQVISIIVALFSGAATGVVCGIPSARRFRLMASPDEDLSPASLASSLGRAAPQVIIESNPEAGPVLISVTFRVDSRARKGVGRSRPRTWTGPPSGRSHPLRISTRSVRPRATCGT